LELSRTIGSTCTLELKVQVDRHTHRHTHRHRDMTWAQVTCCNNQGCMSNHQLEESLITHLEECVVTLQESLVTHPSVLFRINESCHISMSHVTYQ